MGWQVDTSPAFTTILDLMRLPLALTTKIARDIIAQKLRGTKTFPTVLQL